AYFRYAKGNGLHGCQCDVGATAATHPNDTRHLSVGCQLLQQNSRATAHFLYRSTTVAKRAKFIQLTACCRSDVSRFDIHRKKRRCPFDTHVNAENGLPLHDDPFPEQGKILPLGIEASEHHDSTTIYSSRAHGYTTKSKTIARSRRGTTTSCVR